MREDLDFLYQKAICSHDIDFIDEVAVLLELENRFDDADKLAQRAENMWNIKYDYSDYRKFSFLIEDSQMGRDWYRNRK